MRLVNCKDHGQKPPRGAFYIGRATPKLERSVLANKYIPKSRAKAEEVSHAIVVPDEPKPADGDRGAVVKIEQHKVLERYRRHLTWQVLHGYADLEALMSLTERSVLACWCCDREAELVGAGAREVEVPCHGDVIYTVWQALDGAEWKITHAKYGDEGFYRAWGTLYQVCFGEPMRWGKRGDDDAVRS